MFKRFFLAVFYLSVLLFLFKNSSLVAKAKEAFLPVKQTDFLAELPEQKTAPHKPQQGPANKKTYRFNSSEEVLRLYKPPERKRNLVVETSLPELDTLSIDYINFRSEVLAYIKKAEKKARIKTTYGVFVMDLQTGYYCGINESLTRVDSETGMKEGYFNSASVIKMFQGYILCDMMRSGELSMDEYYYDRVTGRRFKLLNMLSYMISHSDNNYCNATLRLIGNAKSNEVLDGLGIVDSRIYAEISPAIGYSAKNNLKRYGTTKRCARITPKEAGLILYNVFRLKDSDLYMKTLNEALLGNIYNTRIPIGVKRVNGRYRIAHKTGTNSEIGVYNDAGIVYGKYPFILVTFTQSTSDYTGHLFIRTLSEDLTRYFDAKAVK